MVPITYSLLTFVTVEECVEFYNGVRIEIVTIIYKIASRFNVSSYCQQNITLTPPPLYNGKFRIYNIRKAFFLSCALLFRTTTGM